jgi:imidazolonepropionase-like amidohydrolase
MRHGSRISFRFGKLEAGRWKPEAGSRKPEEKGSSMKRAFIVAIAAGLMLALQNPAAQEAPTVAFTNVNVVPMDSNRVLSNQTVVVTKDRITAVGPAGSTRVPDGATRVEGRGKYLMPGLAEMHGHIPNPTNASKTLIDDVLYLYVAAGITTVRGMQGAPGQLDLREASKRGEIVAPNLYLAGPAFNANSVKSAEDAVARVKQQKAEGWDLLKVLGGLSVESYDAMAKTAKDAGIRFAGHVPAAVGVVHALEMGQDTIDHVDGYAEVLEGQTKPVDEKAMLDLVGRTKKAGTAIVPTLVVWETLRGPVTLESRTSQPELKYLPRSQVQAWTKGLENRLKNPQYNAEHAKIYIDNRMRILRALHAAKVNILLGSDAPQQFNVPGYSIHREMKRMLDGGMSLYDVIRSGTVNVGEYFKAQDQFGTVAVGQRADLILCDANPLQNVDNMGKRSGVMIRGRWLPDSEIQSRLSQIAGRSAAPTQ